MLADKQDYPGGPPAIQAGTAYDPINDEIVMFPHLSSRDDPKNLDRLNVDGRISPHFGTFRYSFGDNTWRRAGNTFGTEETRKARADVLAAVGLASEALDTAWILRRRPKDGAADKVAQKLVEAGKTLVAATLPSDADNSANKADAALTSAAAAAGKGDWNAALAFGRDALWAMESVLDRPLRVEPPRRCAAPMVYDPKNEVIVLFGGHTGLVRTDLPPDRGRHRSVGALNDTWLYDCRTRQWRELAADRRPPVTRRPLLKFDPASGLLVLLTFEESKPVRATLWTLDVAKGEWSKRHEQEWPGARFRGAGWGTSDSIGELALDEQAGILIFSQTDAQGREELFAMRWNAAALPSESAPAWEAPPPIRPAVLPPDDPDWMAKLENLPANRWVRANPKDGAQPARRDWSNMGLDPVRGHLYYFGGGHSTYQVNDVAIYAIGANVWTHAPGDHNDSLPPINWCGMNMGLRGGNHAHHQRNQYQALDGRMWAAMGAGGTGMGYWHNWNQNTIGVPVGHEWFYDADRGGIWRVRKLAEMDMGTKDGLPPWAAQPHLADPAGRMLSMGPIHRNGMRNFFVFDPFRQALKATAVPDPVPTDMGESRPFALMPDRNQVFVQEQAGQDGLRHDRQGTWVYDIAANSFTRLEPHRQAPLGVVVATEYIQGQNAVAVFVSPRDKRGQEAWVYSFEHNTFVQIPPHSEDGDGHMPRISAPFGHVVYAAKFGVFVVADGTWLMRPDVAALHGNE